MRRVYLDYNATTPLDGEVLQQMLPYLQDHFGNPSSIHWFGQQARRAVDLARAQVADLIGADPSEIVFCSGGTEADNLAISGAVPQREGHLITSAVEHPAVLSTCQALQQQGVRVTTLPVDGEGRVNPRDVADSIAEDTALISVMLANNDVGTLQPVAEIAALARQRGILMHTDAVQAAGKLPVDVQQLDVDLLSLSGHKIHGPKGCGALYLRRGVQIASLLHGGAHERGRRAGTENVASIVGLGRACQLARSRVDDDARRQAELRDRLQQGILDRIEGARVNGHPVHRLPNTLNVSFDGIDGEDLQMSLDLMGIAVSTGSACASGTTEPSHVLTAMGRSQTEARGAIRLSVGRGTTDEEVKITLDALVALTRRLRADRIGP